MAEYKAIHGTLFQHKTSDPLAAGVENGTWASGPAMNTARGIGMSGGPSTSSIVAGGYQPPGNTYSASSETFNGSAWTTAPNMNEVVTEPGGFATSSEAAIAAGGYTTASPAGTRATTEEFDGSSWTEVNDMNEGRSSIQGTSWGTTTAGAIAAGVDGGSPGTNETLLEYWNGTAWSEQADLNLGRRDAGGAGTQTAAIVGAGMSGSPYPGTITSNTETWNGSAWTEVAEMNNAQRAFGGSFGTSTSAIFAGGQPPEVTDTEFWDGTSWTEIGNMSTARSGGMGFGLSTDGYAYGDNGRSTAGERFVAAAITDSIQTNGQIFYRSDTGDFKVSLTQFGTGAFSSGTNLPGVRDYTRGIGIQTAALCMGGTNTSPSYAEANDTLSYDGSAWTELAAFNTTRANGIWAADGTQTAAIMAGGEPPALSDTETWDGSSWTEVNNLNTARDNCTSTSEGTSTASLAFMGGTPAPNTAKTELWDGSSWTEVGDLNTSRERGSGGGSSTAAIAIDGAQAPNVANPDGVSYTEIWDGTSWTEVADTNTAHYYGAGWGTTTSALIVGTNPANNVVEQWNGSAWSEVAEMSANRILHGGGTGGSGNLSGIVHGGDSPPYSAAVEEWNIPQSISNLTITD